MKRKNNSQSTQIKVAVIGAVAVVLAAIIGSLPDSSGKPLICNITSFGSSIAACGSVNIALPEGTQIALTATQDSIAATQTALAQTPIPTASATQDVAGTALAQTVTAIAATQTATMSLQATISPTNKSTCNTDALFNTQSLDQIGRSLNAGTGIFTNAIHPYGNEASPYEFYRDINIDYPCMQNISPALADDTDRNCYVSLYTTNIIWFGSIVSGTSIEIRKENEVSYKNIGVQTRVPSDSIGYVIMYDIQRNDEICIVAPTNFTMRDIANAGGYHMRIGVDIFHYIRSWCNILENDGTRHYCN